MNLRFQKSQELITALTTLSVINDSAYLNLKQEHAEIVVESENACNGAIIMPADFFLSYHGLGDTFGFSLKAMLQFFSKQGELVSMDGFEMNLVEEHVLPQSISASNIKLLCNDFLRALADSPDPAVFYLKNKFFINNQRVRTETSVKTVEIISKYPKRWLDIIMLNITRYCELSFATDQPLRIEYPFVNFRLVFIVAPVIGQ